MARYVLIADHDGHSRSPIQIEADRVEITAHGDLVLHRAGHMERVYGAGFWAAINRVAEQPQPQKPSQRQSGREKFRGSVPLTQGGKIVEPS